MAATDTATNKSSTTSGATNTLRLIDRRFSMRPCSSCPSKTARTVATPNDSIAARRQRASRSLR
jgi:hypothetical protein